MEKSNVTICIIDDDESVRRALKRLLKSTGYSVTAHDSARDFLDYDISGTCLLVIDVQMPEIDGFGLLDILTESGSKLPAIFITALEDSAIRKKAMDSGAFGFLQKPFSDHELLDVVEQWMSQLEPAPEPAAI